MKICVVLRKKKLFEKTKIVLFLWYSLWLNENLTCQVAVLYSNNNNKLQLLPAFAFDYNFTIEQQRL